jgi:tetratricopeptide (TPR) repeat protein
MSALSHRPNWHHATAVLLLMPLLALPMPALAAPPPTASVHDAPLTTLFDLSHDEPALREIAFDVARSLRRSKQVRYRDLDEELNRGAEDSALASVRSGDGLVKSGRAKLNAGQYSMAADDFEAAVESYLEAYAVLPDLAVLPRALALLAVAQLLDGDGGKAATNFARSVQSDLKYEQDFTEFPAKVQTVYDAARKDVLARPRVQYEVRTTPPNARVYVNGVYQGLSPVWVKSTAGEQFIAMSKPGSARRAKVLRQTQPDSPALTEELAPAKRKATFDAVTAALAEIFEGAVEPNDLTQAQGLAGASYAVVLRASGSRDQMKVELALANLAGRQVVNRLTREIKWQKRDKELIDKLVDELFHIPELPVYEGPAVVGGTPVYKTWWFWTVIGVAAAGSTVAVLLATRKSAPAAAKFGADQGGLSIRF